MTSHQENGYGQGHIPGTAEASRQILCAGRIYQVLALGWLTTPNGRGQGHVARFLLIFPPIIYVEWGQRGEARHVKFRLLIDTQEY